MIRVLGVEVIEKITSYKDVDGTDKELIDYAIKVKFKLFGFITYNRYANSTSDSEIFHRLWCGNYSIIPVWFSQPNCYAPFSVWFSQSQISKGSVISTAESKLRYFKQKSSKNTHKLKVVYSNRIEENDVDDSYIDPRIVELVDAGLNGDTKRVRELESILLKTIK